jgi:hypothetical protein
MCSSSGSESGSEPFAVLFAWAGPVGVPSARFFFRQPSIHVSKTLRRTALAFGLSLFLSSGVLAQAPFLLPQGQSLPALSGAGLSSAFGVSVADVGEANPAALGRFEQTEVGV